MFWNWAFSGTIVPLLHEEIVREYREVLGRPKFHLTRDIIEDAVGELERLGVYVDAGAMEIELPGPKDRVFYEVVMEGRKTESAWLVTGNLKHFPVRPFVVTPRQMVEIILGHLPE